MTDVLIAGAGPAGLTCARMLAEQGLSVTVVEKGEREGFGAPWINDTDISSFSRYGLTEPGPEALPFDPSRPARLHSVDDQVCSAKAGIRGYAIRMDTYQKELLAEAERKGARILFRTAALSVLGDGTRATGLAVTDPDGNEQYLAARCVVLACGGSSRVLSSLPDYLDLDLHMEDCDWVSAVQEVWTLKKRNTNALVREGRLFDNAMVAYCGMPGAGAFSTLLYQMDLSRGIIGVLGGSKTRMGGVRGPASIIREFLGRFPVANRKLYGGGREIPLRYAADSLVSDGLVLLGDAGRCVCPANGSGTVSAMITAAFCARALAPVLKRGDAPTRKNLWDMNVSFHTGLGAIYAGYYITMRTTSKLKEEDVQRLIKRKVIGIGDFYQAHENRPVALGPVEALQRLARGIGVPGPVLSVAGRGPVIMLMMRHYRSYPRVWDRKKFRDWRRKRDLILSLARL
ncbi:MAG: NAD(P)/FAD-dependent oxidoreductase [Thermodesulfobacteriota bacterium]